MDSKAPDNRLYVVVGILQNAHGCVLIQQRRPGTPKPGKWEFPGGKLEEGEEPDHALGRELKEELGIDVGQIAPLIVVTHNYDHARVRLDTYLVTEFDGEPEGREGQNIAWVSLEQILKYDVLDAVLPIVQAIRELR